MSNPCKKVKRKFVKMTEALCTTGYSRDWFMTRVKSGTFQRGVHYRDTSDGAVPRWEWCIEEIEALYEN